MLCHASCVLVFIPVLLFSYCRGRNFHLQSYGNTHRALSAAYKTRIQVLSNDFEILNSKKPTISPNQKELVINEGDPLEIVCTGNFPGGIKFAFPRNTEKVNTSRVTTTEYKKDGVHTLILRREVTVFGDTGWYGCADKNVWIASYAHDDSKANWLYVYVKSDRNFFVKSSNLTIICTDPYRNVVIPCRPTSPDLVVNFETENEIELKNKTSFDPKIGFTIRNIQITDRDRKISCIIEKDNYKQISNYTLYVERNQYLFDLFIGGESVHPFTRGEDLRLNCTVGIHNATEYNLLDGHLRWFRSPKLDKSRISTQLFTKKIGANKYIITSQLTIFNTTDKDVGKYHCYIKKLCEFKRTSKDVILRGKQSVTTLRIAYYALNKNVEFTYKVTAELRPNTSLTYHKYPNYPLLTNSTEIQVTNQTRESFSISYITIRITIEALGVLTYKSCNDLGCNKTIEVMSVSGGVDPLNIIVPKQLIRRDDKVELICGALIYNYTNKLTWKNEKESIEETSASGRIKIKRDKTPLTYLSILTIHQAQQSDAQIYTCYGQVRSDSRRSKLPVSTSYELVVEEPPYFIMTNMNEIVPRNIDVTQYKPKTEVLMCIANGLPKPEITWYKDGELIKENARYKFTNNYQKLTINYISRFDSGIYSCRAQNREGIKEAFQEIKVHEGWDEGYIILTSSVVILVIVLLILAAFSIMKVRRDKKRRKELIEMGLMNFEKGALECLNPDLTVDDQAELLPYDEKWEFPRKRLKLGKQLGSGVFGVVMEAEAQRICAGELVTTVAVKMPRRSTDPTYVRALASELKIMVHLGMHLNIVNLLGACTKNISKCELLVIVEYCRFGNLHNYLLRHRTDFINQIDPNTRKLDNTIGLDTVTRTVNVSSNNSLNANSSIDTVQYYLTTRLDSQEICSSSNNGCIFSKNLSQPDRSSNYYDDCKDHNLKSICTQDLLSWAFQVARGMEYLSQKKVLHGDLAARNILLTEDNIVKICDFGLAKDIYQEGNYKKKGDTRLPIKWMAIESIKDRIFSTQSDVWSYGIVLWEFFTLAETPYPGMEVEKQYQKLIEGYRLEQPEYATREIYDIMLQCWQAKPVMRPRFTHLVTSIGDLLNESVKSHYINLNIPYMDMNKIALESGKNDYLAMMSAPEME